MNKRRRPRILRLRLGAGPREKGVYRPARRLSLKVIGASALVALVAAGALGFAALNLVHSKIILPKHAPSTRVASAKATASPLTAGSQNPVVANASQPRIAPAPTPTASPSAAPIAATRQSPVPVPTQTPEATAVTTTEDNDDRHEQKTPPGGLRKSAEQARREAERKRARLEAMYKKHLISEEEYKKGQSEYQEAIAKYRNTVGGSGEANE